MSDRSQAPVRGWLKNPWFLLIFGGALLLGLWVGIGLRIEHLRRLAAEEIRQTPGVQVSKPLIPFKRFPAWVPDWLGKLLPEDSRLTINVIHQITFSRAPTDHELILLSRLPGLQRLEFADGNSMSDRQLLDLIQKNPLTELGFSPPKIFTLQHLAALAENKQLERLCGLQGPFDQSEVDGIAQIKSLTSVELRGPLEGSADIAGLARSLELWGITWDRSGLKDDQFAHLASIPTLTNLKLGETQLTAESWSLLDKMQLEDIDLESPEIDDSTVRRLIAKGKLSRLRLRGGSISDRGIINELLKLPQLTHFEIDVCGCTVECMRAMATRGYWSLYIRGGLNVTDEWLADLVEEDFAWIEILNSAITDEGIEVLRGRQELSQLALPGARLTDRCVGVLNTLSALKSLDIRNTAITDAGLQELAIVNGDPYMQMNIGGAHVTVRGAKEFLSRHPKRRIEGIKGSSPQRASNKWRPLKEAGRDKK